MEPVDQSASSGVRAGGLGARPPPESQTQLVSTGLHAVARPKTQVPPGQLGAHSRFRSRPSGLAAALPALGATGCVRYVWCRHQPAAEAQADSGCASREHSHTTSPLCPVSPTGQLPARAARNQPRGSRTVPAPSLLNSPSTHNQLPIRNTGCCTLCVSLSLGKPLRICSFPTVLKVLP